MSLILHDFIRRTSPTSPSTSPTSHCGLSTFAAITAEAGTVVMLQGEFGRRVFDNADIGTDHGSGADILVVGGPVNGGQFFGRHNGLNPAKVPNALFQNADVMTTTDYRNVFAEVLIRHLGNPELGTILPEFNPFTPADDNLDIDAPGYNPLGFINGDDLVPNYGPQDAIAKTGFE